MRRIVRELPSQAQRRVVGWMTPNIAATEPSSVGLANRGQLRSRAGNEPPHGVLTEMPRRSAVTTCTASANSQDRMGRHETQGKTELPNLANEHVVVHHLAALDDLRDHALALASQGSNDTRPLPCSKRRSSDTGDLTTLTPSMTTGCGNVVTQSACSAKFGEHNHV